MNDQTLSAFRDYNVLNCRCPERITKKCYCPPVKGTKEQLKYERELIFLNRRIDRLRLEIRKAERALERALSKMPQAILAEEIDWKRLDVHRPLKDGKRQVRLYERSPLTNHSRKISWEKSKRGIYNKDYIVFQLEEVVKDLKEDFLRTERKIKRINHLLDLVNTGRHMVMYEYFRGDLVEGFTGTLFNRTNWMFFILLVFIWFVIR